MTQHSNTAFIRGARWKMWLLKVFAVLHLTAVCAAQDNVYVTQTSDIRPVASSLPATVYDPPTPTLKRLTGWPDVFENEVLELSCEVSGSEWTFTWYRNGVKLKKEGPSLKITSVTQTDQGQYTCKAHLKSRGVSSGDSNIVDVQVYTSKPKPTVTQSPSFATMYPGESVLLTCTVSVSSGWDYVWYHNGTEIQASNNDTYSIASIVHSNSGEYRCKAKRGEGPFYTEDSDLYSLQVSDPPTPTLKQLTGWQDVFENEVLELSCEVSGSEWTFTWYRNGVELKKEGPSLKITSVTQTDQGQYTCKAHLKSRVSSGDSNIVNVQVYTSKPKPTVTQSPSFATMYPGESVLLTCTVSVSSGWDYVWYHNGTEIQASDNDTYSIASIVHSNSGEYRCKAKRGEGPFYTEDSDLYSLQVSDPPTPTLKRLTGWPDVFENEVLELSCEVSGSEWTFTWYRNGVELKKEGPSLKITSVTQTDQGQYTCKAHLKSRGVSSGDSNKADVQVYTSKPKPTVTQSPSFATMYPGESVLLTCTVSVSSGWDYVWYHNGTEIQASDNDTYSIASIVHSNSGEYRCKAKRGEGPFYTEDSDTYSLQVSDPPTPTLKQLTGWPDVFENEVLELSCEVSGSEWTFTWYRNGVELKKEGPSLKITSVTQTDQGQYTCKAHLKSRGVSSGDSNKADVQVYSSKPKPTVTQSPSFATMYPGESVLLTCTVDMSSGWDYVWYHNGTEIQASNNDTYSIASIVHSNSGEYRCKAKRGEGPFYTEDSDTYSLQVSEIPVPSLKNATKWLDVFPNEAVKLSCGMQGSSGWTYTWYKDAEEVRLDEIVTSEMDGTTLTISSSSSSHRGMFSCSGNLKGRSVTSSFSSNVALHVYDATPGVTIVQNPEASLMHTGDSVSFSCHINVSSGWDYMWFKNDSPMPTSGNNHNIGSALTTDTGSYKCQVKRGEHTVFKSSQSQPVDLKISARPQAIIILQTSWSEAFSTDSLLLKCEVADDNSWNYTWFREGEKLDLPPAETHKVTPQNDPEQSLYVCQGVRHGRPSYSQSSQSYKTKNLLLKRRVLLSISGCLFFGIIAIFLGCIFLRIFRKPVANDEKPDESELFLSMTKLKDSTDAPCPLVEYITDSALKAGPKEVDDNLEICSETTPLPITSREDQAVMTNGQDATENGGALVSFQQ
ncbi:basement membrane-specific heparan sulfate proteoglycan core protein [Odontesthes bonariensis]|uniref:basement membrane-specific heparan sulfate proteoglycan core protein n=1 Tax=Odontesthes bonariensis TaxID=219752 RepID=UPI003F58E291